MSRKRLDIQGQRFGRLIAQQFIGRDEHGHAMWRCVCDCGKQLNIAGSRLVRGHNKSCGCLRGEWYFAKNLSDREYLIRRLSKQYSRHAKKRGLEWQLPEDVIRLLVQTNCYYCGQSPKNKLVRKKVLTEYNGVDRLDSNKGYICGNVVPCCGLCNRMKSDLSTDAFIEHIQKIFRRLNG